MTPIEAMARAMCLQDGFNPDRETKAGHGNPVIMGWEHYVAIAQTALQALKENVSEEILDAVQEVLDGPTGHEFPSAEEVVDAMIDAALDQDKEKTDG